MRPRGLLQKSRMYSLNQLNRKPSFPSKTIIALRINPESPSLYPLAITNFRSTHNPYNFLRLKAVHIQYHCARTPSKPLWLHRQNPNARLTPPISALLSPSASVIAPAQTNPSAFPLGASSPLHTPIRKAPSASSPSNTDMPATPDISRSYITFDANTCFSKGGEIRACGLSGITYIAASAP